jgi:hypothetical protein
MAARVDELCDAAKAVIEAAAIANPIPGTTITVTCDDDPDVDADTLPAGQMYVMVWWDSYSDAGPVTHGEDATDYRLCCLVVEKYGEAGAVATAWRRERTAWVETCVRQALGNPRVALDDAYPTAEGDVMYDQDELIERKLFWTKVEITFRDERGV